MLKFSLCVLVVTSRFFTGLDSFKVDSEFLDRVLVVYNSEQPCSRQIVLVSHVAVDKESEDDYDVSKLTLHGEMKNGDNRNVTLRALEVAPDGFRRTLLLESGVFEKAYLVYTQVVPRMKDLMKAAEDTSEPLFLDLMDAKNGSYVVFRIPEFGWSSASSGNMVPTLPVMELALRSLAKWHAMGAVLLEKGQIPKKQFSERLPLKHANEYASVVLNNFADVVRDTWGKKWTRLAQQMKDTVPQVDMKFRIIFNRTNEQDAFNVFNYGDFLGHDTWFNYGISDTYKTDRPIAIKFQYFETTHINTPATDIHHVIYSTQSTRIALKHKDDLIENVYYPALIGYLSRFGYGGNKPTLKRLKDELRQSELYGVITSMSHISAAFEDEPLDMAMLEETWKTGKVSTNMTGMLHRGFSDAMKPVMEYARDRNVFGLRNNDENNNRSGSESESDSDSDSD